MKSFDLRPAFIEKPAQGQQTVGGHNSANNCVPDSCLECYQALTGKWPCNPQDITSAVYGPRYIGGETFGRVVGFMRSRNDLFPELPDVEVHDFGSSIPMEAIGDCGAKGFPMAASFYCDANGVIQTHATGILHASCPVASDGRSVKVWNVEGYEVAFSLADFARAYQGALVIFKRSIKTEVSDMMTLSERKAWVFDGFVELFGRNPNSEQEFMDVVNVVNPDRSNLFEVRMSMWNNPIAVAYRQAQSTGSAGQAYVPAKHSHSGTVSVT